MAQFILVHGSGQNSGSWERVAKHLHEAGHEVATPELSKSDPRLRLGDHADAIAREVRSQVALVVAHSFCGVLLPLIAARARCSGLIFLAAVIPEPGRSVRAQFAEDRSMFNPAWIAAGPRWFVKSEVESLAGEFLFHDVDAASMPWSLSTLETIDTQNLVTESAPFGAWPKTPTVTIVASKDRTLSPDWCRRRSLAAFGRPALEIESGHCPQNSRPTELADLLLHVLDTHDSS